MNAGKEKFLKISSYKKGEVSKKHSEIFLNYDLFKILEAKNFKLFNFQNVNALGTVSKEFEL